MAIKVKGTTILDDTRNLLSGNTVTAMSFVGPLTGNATTVTNGVYTIGNQSIDGVKTFTSNTIFDTNTLFVDAVNNRVGIGTVTPTESLHVEGTARALSFASANGSVTSPAFDFVADTNTGMYLAGTDILGFSTNGSIAASFTSTGNLRLYNTAGTFYSELSNQPTSNNILTLPTTTSTLATTANLSQFAATTSAQLAGVISDETGTGLLVFGTSPTFTTGINAASASMSLFDTTATTINFAGAATTGNFGYDGTANSTTNISVGAVASGSTKTVNIGTGGATGSTTSITLGDADGGTTTINSPSLVVPGNLSVGANIIATTGPILTLGALTAGGTGYMNGTHTNVSLTGGTGTNMLATVVVSAGVVNTITPTWGGNRYTIADTLTVGSLDTTINITAVVGNTTVSVVSFDTQPSAPFEAGSQIIVASAPTGYNGTFSVISSNTTSVSYPNGTSSIVIPASGTVKMGAALTNSTVPVATIQGSDIYVSSAVSSSIGARIRLEYTTAGAAAVAANTEYGAIVFSSRDTTPQASGDLGLIRGIAASGLGGSQLEFWTAASATAPTKSAVITSGGNFRLFDTTGAFYTEIANAPTTNVIVNMPALTVTSDFVLSEGAATINGAKTFSGLTLNAPLIHSAVNSRDKLRVWNTTPYSIGMSTPFNFGAIDTDYAMTFQMNNSPTRGFWWGDDAHSNNQGAMALSTNGKLTVADSIRVGYGESDTTVPGITNTLDVLGDVYFANNVGVGVLAPKAAFHVRQDLDGMTGAIIQNRNATGTPVSTLNFITGPVDLADNRYAYIRSQGSFVTSLSFGTSDSAPPLERMIITPSGNVGIGNTTPTHKLSVNGSFIADGIETTGEGVVVSRSDGFSFGTHITNGTGTNFVYRATDHRFFNANFTTEFARIANNGSVGIGTTDPETLLHVAGGGPTATKIRLSGGNGQAVLDANNSGIEILSNIVNTSNFKYLPSIKFGSTDPQLESLNPRFGAAIVAEGAENFSSNTDGGMNLSFWTSPIDPGLTHNLQQRMTILSDGNVGIGTPTPSELLHITGNIRVTGKYADSTGSFGTEGQVLTANSTANYWATPSAGGTTTTRVVQITDGTSITVNVNTTDIASQTNTQAAGTLTINAPTGTPTDGQKFIIRVTCTNIQTLAFNAIFLGSSDVILPPSTTGTSKTDYLGFIYNSTSAKWHLLSRNFGF